MTAARLLFAAALLGIAATAVAAPTPFRVDVEDWEGPAREEGYVVVTIEADAGHKINLAYPQRVRLDDPPAGLSLPLQELTMKHAQLENERRLVFTIPAIPEREGSFAVKGTIKLSVCSASECLTRKHALRARITAQ